MIYALSLILPLLPLGAVFYFLIVRQQRNPTTKINSRLTKPPTLPDNSTIPDFLLPSDNANNTVSVDTGNVADELKKYKELFDQGAISEEDFNNIKSKLLGKL